MALILCIETATPTCSVALVNDEKVIGLQESDRKNSHAEVVTVFIQLLLQKYEFEPGDLDAIAVSMGPGSYTGLRIGVSTAKGMCYATGKPLIALNTLQSMAFGMVHRLDSTPYQPYLIPMIDARRMEVYAAVFDSQGNSLRETKAEIVDEGTYQQYLAGNKVIFFGDGAPKCKGPISHTNAIFIDDFTPSAAYMHREVIEKFRKKQFEDVAYFEPFYLKDFIAGIPRVKGLK